MKDKYTKDDQICLVVNNELVCVNSHAQADYEAKKFEKKLNRAAKVMEQSKHSETVQAAHFVDNQFICVDDHHH